VGWHSITGRRIDRKHGWPPLREACRLCYDFRLSGVPVECAAMIVESTSAAADIAVLVSGGLDSAILVATLARQGNRVYPIYISTSLAWEEAELHHLRRFLAALDVGKVEPLVVLQQPTDDLYDGHWSVTRDHVPDAATPDEAVYLPGRNPLLLVKAAIWCRLRNIERLALAPLASNPFPDATPEFFEGFGRLMGQATGGTLQILRPFERMHKAEVMRLGEGLPLAETFSCINPVGMLHCGACNKCAERQAAFRDAGMSDPTVYANSSQSGAPKNPLPCREGAGGG
jgi:7-cyano-7-deazaguanine synthase